MDGVLVFHLCFYFVSMNLHGWNLLYMDGWITVLDEQCETFVICKDGTIYVLVMYVYMMKLVCWICLLCIYVNCCVYLCISMNCCQIE